MDELPREFEGKANAELASVNDGIERADIVLLLVDHDPFRMVARENLDGKTVIDTKGLWR